MRINSKVKKWRSALLKPECGCYYSAKPCRAKTCNENHEYCKNHKKIVQKEKNEVDN